MLVYSIDVLHPCGSQKHAAPSHVQQPCMEEDAPSHPDVATLTASGGHPGGVFKYLCGELHVADTINRAWYC